jgi:hypothetical protein
MNTRIAGKYASNSFLLMLPVLIWNIVLAKKLPAGFQPEVFWRDIPVFLKYGEHISRMIVFVLAFLMPLDIPKLARKRGFYLYLGGMLIYFFSWTLLIYFPNSSWSNSLAGFAAPAYTPLFWLAGIGLLGDSFYFNLPFRRYVFILASITSVRL